MRVLNHFNALILKNKKKSFGCISAQKNTSNRNHISKHVF
jgi:hypothetical protein